MEEQRRLFVLLLFCFNFLVWIGLIFFKFSFVGHCRGKGRTWRDWEVSGIRVHDVKFAEI